MDGITPRNVERNAYFTGAVGFQGKEEKSTQGAEPKDQVSLRDMLQLQPEDFNPSGTVNVIIQPSDPKEIAQLEAQLSQDSRNKIKRELPIIGGFSAEVDPTSRNVAQMMGGNDVKVFLDGKIGIIEPVEKLNNDVHIMMDVAGKAMGIDKVWDKGFKGKDTTICVIDTGIARHPDVKDRIIGFKDIITGKEGPENAYDDQGHGTHCASIAAGDGSSSGGKFVGAAPEANLVGVKVLSANGGGAFSDVIAGIQWAVENKDKFKIDVISMSLGGSVYQSYKDDPVSQAVEKAVDKGIVTVVAAGNSGPKDKTIGTPANSPHVLTIGALDDKGTVQRDDDSVAYFSSRGPTNIDKLPKPDVLTPGVKITAANYTGGYVAMSGTSMACPLAAGMTALIKQAVPTITPGEMKGVVMGSADDLNKLPHKDQGAGVFNVAKSIEKLTGMEIIPPPPPPPPPNPAPVKP
jgi:serine protease AprX